MTRTAFQLAYIAKSRAGICTKNRCRRKANPGTACCEPCRRRMLRYQLRKRLEAGHPQRRCAKCGDLGHFAKTCMRAEASS